MKNIKKKSIDVLCNFGKFGLGKSITLGMYDFEVPAQLMTGVNQNDDRIQVYQKGNQSENVE